MIRICKFITKMMVLTVISALFITPVLAVPLMPSSFYGMVKVNDQNVPDGTVIRALIDGEVYAEGYSLTYEGDSVYTLDVPSDDSDTTQVDGGRENDPVQFEIGGVLSDQTGNWESGTNVNLDLTASTDEDLTEPYPTPTPVPTQTPVTVDQSSTVPIGESESASDSMVSQPSLPDPTNTEYPTSTAILFVDPEQETSIVDDSASTQVVSILSSPIPGEENQPTQFSPINEQHSTASDSPVNLAVTKTDYFLWKIALGALAIPLIGVIVWIVARRGYNVRKPNGNQD